jgi:hypothetical protein
MAPHPATAQSDPQRAAWGDSEGGLRARQAPRHRGACPRRNAPGGARCSSARRSDGPVGISVPGAGQPRCRSQIDGRRRQLHETSRRPSPVQRPHPHVESLIRSAARRPRSHSGEGGFGAVARPFGSSHQLRNEGIGTVGSSRRRQDHWCDSTRPEWAAKGQRPTRREGGFWETEVRLSRASDRGGGPARPHSSRAGRATPAVGGR